MASRKMKKYKVISRRKSIELTMLLIKIWTTLLKIETPFLTRTNLKKVLKDSNLTIF